MVYLLLLSDHVIAYALKELLLEISLLSLALLLLSLVGCKQKHEGHVGHNQATADRARPTAHEAAAQRD